MGNWGISPNASEKEKIKADYADILHGMNSTGTIPCDVYSDLFDDGMELLDRMYEQGKADAPTADVVEVVRCRDCKWLYDEMDDYCCRSHRGLARICENSFCSYGERRANDQT